MAGKIRGFNTRKNYLGQSTGLRETKHTLPHNSRLLGTHAVLIDKAKSPQVEVFPSPVPFRLIRWYWIGATAAVPALPAASHGSLLQQS